MKKILCVVICVALLCASFVVASYAQQEEELVPEWLVVLGDSIAAGHGVTLEEGYAFLLAQATGLELQNFAFDGETSASLYLEVTQNEFTRYLIADANIIIVSIGGNDFLLAEGLDGLLSLIVRGVRGDHSFMPQIWETFAENFAAIITEIRYLNPDATLIVQTVYNSAPPLPSVRQAFGIAMRGINSVIYAYLEENPGAFLIADIYSAFEGRNGTIARDMVHPSVAGHAIIATVILDLIAGTETPLPRASLTLDVLEFVFRPALWLVDLLLIRVGLRLLGPVFF